MHRAPVIGRVLSVDRIHGADQVRLAVVDVGDAHLQIVFGGRPLDLVDCLVPVAPPGARVARQGTAVNVKMRARRFRSTLSQGMLCSLVELGWTDSGPDEVAVLRRGEIGNELPSDGDLSSWLSDDCYRRHVDHFLTGADREDSPVPA